MSLRTNRPSFDVQKFISRFTDLEDLAVKSALIFLKSLPAMTSKIEIAIQQDQRKEIEVASHTLRGAVSNFYAEPSQFLALKLEKLSGKAKAPELNQVFKELTSELEKLTIEIQTWLESRNNK